MKETKMGRPHKYTSEMKTVTIMYPIDADVEVKAALLRIKKKHLRVKPKNKI